MNGYQIVSEAVQQINCVLLTGVSGAGKTHISKRLAKHLKLKDVIELDEIMRQLVIKTHPKLKGFYKEHLIEYFGDMKEAKRVMWVHQLPALKQSLAKYGNKPTLLEGMIIYMPQSNFLIDKFQDCRIYAIKPTSPNEHLRKAIEHARKDNYNIPMDIRKRIVDSYKKEVVELRKFIQKYGDRVELIDN